MKSYRFKCRNPKCGAEFHKYYPVEEFEKAQYTTGWGCFTCGYPKMAVIKSNAVVKDGFKPGFQRNIMKHCSSYSEYKQHLKNMGLIELGYEELPETEEHRTQYWDDDVLKMLWDMGHRFGSNEAEYLKEMHKDNK